MQGCTIQNVTNLGYGGFISTSSLGAVTMFSNSTFIGGKFSGVGGAFLVGSSGGGSLIVSGNSKLSSNIADYGAAIAILDGGSLSLLDNAQIFGNTATKCGSAIYISGGSSSTISSNVTIQDNQGARGAFLCLASDFANTSNIILLSSNNIAGSVWLPSRDLAKNFSDTMISSGVSLSGSIYPVSVPVSLSVLNSTKSSPVSFSVGPYESLPPFSIQVLDYFKNPSVISVANGDRIPVLYLNSVKRNGSIQRNVLTGEVSKIGLSSIVKFDQVSVSAMDGEYEYEVLAYRGAVDFDNTSVVWPMVSINVIACNGSNERLLQLSAGDMACYQTCPISITSKNSFGSLGVILAITSFLSVFLWVN